MRPCGVLRRHDRSAAGFAEVFGEGTDAGRIRVSINNFSFNFVSPWIAQHATARTIIASVPYEHGP
jgi:hypothetical protein